MKRLYGDNYQRVEKELKAWFKNLPNGHPAKDHSHYNKVDENGIYFSADISWPGGGGLKYPVIHPVTQQPVKIPSRGWLTNKETMEQWIKEGRVDFGEDEQKVPTLKFYLKDKEYSVPYSVFYKDGRASSKRLKELLGNKVFENPKDEEIIQRIIQFVGTDNGDIIMDFFSGSGTTGHAVFLANIAQNKSRQFILVQIPEIIDINLTPAGSGRKVAENAVRLLDASNRPHNICEIGKERIRRAGKKIIEEHPEVADSLDIGFRVLKLDESNMNDVYHNPSEYSQDLLSRMESNVKEDRTDLDLLFGCLLEWGLPLSLPYNSKKIEECTVHNYNDGDLIACFDEKIPDSVIKNIAKRKPLRAVFRDSSFADSPSKINVGEIFKLLSPDTRVKVI